MGGSRRRSWAKGLVTAVLLVAAACTSSPEGKGTAPDARTAGAKSGNLETSKPLNLQESGGSNPTVAVDSKGDTIHLAWTRQAPGSAPAEGHSHEEGGHQEGGVPLQVVVARSSDGGRTFSDPMVASGADADVVSDSVSPARVGIGPAGEIFVLYGRLVHSDYLDAGRAIPRIARSDDGGRSFSPAVDVAAAEGPEASARMANLTIASDGAVHVFWLDFREEIARAKLAEDQRPEDEGYLNSDDPKVQVRVARSTDRGKTFGPSVLLSEAASERALVATVAGPGGVLYASWRSKLDELKDSYDAVRDIMVSSSTDGGATWSPAAKVHDDKFKTSKCPEVAAGIATDSKGRLHVAWWAGGDGRAGVYRAVSRDRGKTFSKPLTLLTDTWVPYADAKVAVDGDDNAWVVFEDRRDKTADKVVLARVDPRGGVSLSRAWPGSAPDVTVHDDEAVITWAGENGAIRTVTARRPGRGA